MMKRFAVIGHPLGHSLSPLMHNTAFQILGLNHHYEAFDLEADALKSSVERFRDPLWGGFNITTPYKEAVIPLIDEMSLEARTIGSVNTVTNRNGTLFGINTDMLGLQQSLEPVRAEIDGKNCLLLGSGGAARTAAFVLVRLFHPHMLTLAVRSPERAHSIKHNLLSCETGIDISPVSGEKFEEALQSSTLIVNATTVGMYPNDSESPLHRHQLLTSKHIVFDLIYRPLTTRLLYAAHACGARTIDGLEMFLHQGAAAFQLWTGMEMPVSPVRQLLEQTLRLETPTHV